MGGADSAGGTTGGTTGGSDSGSAGATASASGGTSSEPEPSIVDPPTADADLTMTVDAVSEPHPISELIYGINASNMALDDLAALVSEVGFTVARAGGNRFSAYNWETNASNAGSDWSFHNDGYLSESDEPGAAIGGVLGVAESGAAAGLIATQLGDYVAADKDGTDVRETDNHLDVRFFENLVNKPTALSLVPDLEDGAVYQDEFLNWVRETYPNGRWLVTLDNEPDIWADTHAEIWPERPGYDEVVERNIASATMVRAALPGAQILGLASYGWYGWETLQDSPDYETEGEFLNYYLDRMAAAEQSAGQRLIDYVDLHWYPEAQGDETRITEGATTPGAVEARVQAPRSLWDSSYVEDSWISDSVGAIALLPRIKQQIDEHYPGTQLAFAEWDYGAGSHISGGVATADVLGVFGREGVGQASLWHAGDGRAFTYGGFQVYRNYDGEGSAFGDQSVAASVDDVAAASVYAAVDSQTGKLTVVAINKTTVAHVAELQVSAAQQYQSAQVYLLSEASYDALLGTARPTGRPSLRAVQPNAFKVELPAMSVTVLVPSTEAEVAPGPRWPEPAALGAQEGWTFDTDTEGWLVKEDSEPATLAAETTLGWSDTEGDPAPGALRIDVPFSAREQQVQLRPENAALDLTRSRLSLSVRRDGEFDGGIMVYAMSGDDYEWTMHGWSMLNSDDWLTIDINPEMFIANNDAFDPSDIREFGIMFNTGADGSTVPGPVTFYVDTVVYQGAE